MYNDRDLYLKVLTEILARRRGPAWYDRKDIL